MIDCKEIVRAGAIPRAVLAVLEYILIPKYKIFTANAGARAGTLWKGRAQARDLLIDSWFQTWNQAF